MAWTRSECRKLNTGRRRGTCAQGCDRLRPGAPRHHRQGFTLVEILVTIGLILVLVALIGYPILNGMAFMEMSAARADAQSAARLAIDAMTRELAEAIYVFDVPIGGPFVAFLPTRSSGGPVAPIEPEAIAIRYWRALRNPYFAYAPFYQLNANPINTTYVARTQILDPAARDDEWNDSGGALTRAIFWYPDGYAYSGQPWPTAQPGYPWLEAVRLYGAGSPPPTAAYDWYRQRAVGLTPNDADYDIPSFGCAPARMTEEALIAWSSAFPRDYSRYRSRYPLWACFAQWDPGASPQAYESLGQVKIYTGDPRALTYETRVLAGTGAVLVYRVVDDTPVYDTAAYPLRNGQEFAFGIDYDSGEVRFDFQAQDAIAAASSMYIYDLPTVSALSGPGQVVRGSATVWVTDNSGGSTYYTQVDPATDPIGARRFAISGVQLIFDSQYYPAFGSTIHVRYRYRNNPDDQLVVATYDTKAIISISVTVAKRNRAARSIATSRQDVSLATKVKLKNLPR